MTNKEQYKNKSSKQTMFLIPVMLLVLTLGIPQAFAGDYGYQGINPSGTEVKKVKGDFWTYVGGLSNSNKHVDRIFYMYDILDFSVGVGYYDWTNGSGTESYKWLRFWDDGGVYSNFHYLSSTGPSSGGWHSAEIYEVDSKTYGFKIDGSSLGNKSHCSVSCPNPTIAGVASWGTSTSASDNVKADFKNLNVDMGSGYNTWNSASTETKCNNSPSSLKFNYPLASNNVDQAQIDLGSVDECSSNSSVWLYASGGGA